MSNQHRRREQTDHQGQPDRGRQEHTRESGRWGADEPDYGRPRGERPEPEPHTGPNRHGPQYEEGGRYPGTRQGNEHPPLRKENASCH